MTRVRPGPGRRRGPLRRARRPRRRRRSARDARAGCSPTARYRLQSAGVDPVPWRDAWHEALYASGPGFYVTRGGPAAHFTTAAHGPTGRRARRALLAPWPRPRGRSRGRRRRRGRPGRARDPPRRGPRRRPHLGVGVCRRAGPRRVTSYARGGGGRRRPARGTRRRIEWVRSPGGSRLPPELTGLRDALVIAHEWLDVVPCTMAEVDADGTAREVLVDPATGAESLGGPLSAPDRRWAAAATGTRRLRGTASRSAAPVTRPGPTSSRRVESRHARRGGLRPHGGGASVGGDADGIRRRTAHRPRARRLVRRHGPRRDGHARGGRRAPPARGAARPRADRCDPAARPRERPTRSPTSPRWAGRAPRPDCSTGTVSAPSGGR